MKLIQKIPQNQVKQLASREYQAETNMLWKANTD